MTDREKETEIARKLGWQMYPYIINHDWLFCRPGTPLHISETQEAPAYFTDRNASAEIVQWFDEKESPLAQYKFADEIQRAIARRGHLVFIGLVATPRQIAEAALTVWGIGEGEAK